MNHSPDREPLTPDERALAQRLARIGPYDGPSPALDAKILAAAHAAMARAPMGIARSSRRRWPTALGVAASLVVVVGLAWQMQPMLHSPPPIRGPQVTATPVPGSSGELSADVLAPATPLARSAVQGPPAPPLPPLAPVTARAMPVPPRAAVAAPSPVATAAPAPGHFVDEAVPALMNGADATSQAAAEAYAPAPQAMAAPPPPPPPAPMQSRQERMATPQAFPSTVVPEPAARAEMAAKASRRDAAASAGALRSSAATPVLQDQPSVQDDRTLDRIEVTGSRIARANDQVGDDRALEPAAWLQRIRERRDDGDLDAARASLALFRKAHPRIRLPADLRALTP